MTALAKKLSLLLGALFGFVAVGCAGTETGNPGGARLELALQATDPAVASLTSDGTGLHVDEAWLSIASVTLVACPDGKGATLATEPFVADLAAGAPVQGVLPLGEYCGVQLLLEAGTLPASSVVSDAPEGAATVAVYGSEMDGTAFAMLSAAPLTITVPGEPFTVSDKESLLLAFDVSTWLRGDLLGAATVTDTGVVLDGLTHPAVAATFEDQVAASLHRDANGNGAVDGSEAPLAGVH